MSALKQAAMCVASGIVGATVALTALSPIRAQSVDVPDKLKAHKFELVDPSGETSAVLGTDPNKQPMLALRSKHGNFVATANSEGSSLNLLSDAGALQLIAHEKGLLVLLTPKGAKKAGIHLAADELGESVDVAGPKSSIHILDETMTNGCYLGSSRSRPVSSMAIVRDGGHVVWQQP